MRDPLINEPHRIQDVRVTPVAFRDPPLLNTVGVHEPFALRAVVEVVTDSGLLGLGETYGDLAHLERLRLAAAELTGIDVWHVHEIARRIAVVLAAGTGTGGHGMSGNGHGQQNRRPGAVTVRSGVSTSRARPSDGR